MRNIKNLSAILALVLVITISSCTKEGPVGPAGTNGNANVKIFTFANDSLSSTHSFDRYITVKKNYVDSGLVLVYYDPNNGLWYACPGLGLNGTSQTRYYANAYSDSTEIRMSIYNADGSSYNGSGLTLTRVKVIVAPASLVGKTSPVDFNDYKATMKYFGIKE